MLCTHAVQLPLPIHLYAPAQRESGEPFVMPQVAEHRFDGGEARGDHLLALIRVDAPLHPLDKGNVATSPINP
jgi:hypothetical protein